MNQNKILLELYSEEFMDVMLLSSQVEGRFWLYRTTVNGTMKVVEIVARNHKWYFLLPKTMHIKDIDGTCIGIKDDQIYVLCDEHQGTLLLISRRYVKEHHIFHRKRCTQNVLYIGRGNTAEIQYDNPLISTTHARMEQRQDSWYICDMDSTNGVYVNHMKIQSASVYIGDVIDIYGLKIIVAGQGVLINEVDGLILQKRAIVSMKEDACMLHENARMQAIHIAPYTCISSTCCSIDVEGPPKLVTKESLPLIYMLGPSITMGLSSVFMALYSLYNAIVQKQDIAQVIPTILMAISMSLGTMLWPILSKRYEANMKKKEEEHRRQTYTQYLYQLQTTIQHAIEEQQTLLCKMYPQVDGEQEKIAELWSRKPNDESFLACVLGIGDISANISFSYPKESFHLHEDDLYKKMCTIVERKYRLTKVPIILALQEKQKVGIVGEQENCQQFMVQLLYQLAYFHSYQTLKVICIAEPSFLRRYRICYLPHIFSEDRMIRYMIHNKKDSKHVFQHIEKQMEIEDETIRPYYVLFCFLESARGYLSHTFEHKEHVRFLHYAPHKTMLPAYCNEIIYMEEDTACYEGQRATHESCSMHDMACAYGRLANMYIAQEQAMKFPEELTFLDLYECGNIQQLHILQRWQKADVIHSLEAPIGVHEGGEPLCLDAHENYHGPHGLLAGMTGSGKSEVILTFVLSLAVNYSPFDVSFLLIDYKGGAMAKAFEHLPHVAGIITNLETASMQRFLAAIQSELTRRQTIFARISKEYNKSSLDIDTYHSLAQEHTELQPIAHLFMIADEFAELKSLQPEFLECLKQSARIGRSLGIHLILATQKPSGVVDDQIWSNSRFHICLRVQDRSDSQDMLKREEAAYIRRSGVFYFQVGNNEEFKKGLSAYSQAPYEPKELYEKRKNEELTIIDNTGLTLRSRKHRIKEKKKLTQLEAIVLYIAKLSKKQHIHADSIWKKKLPTHLTMPFLEEVYGKHEGMIGCVDDVYHQQQYPYCVPLQEIAHTVIYGHSNSGKELYIETMLTSWIQVYTDALLHIVVLDFEDTSLKKFKEAQIISDVLTLEDTEKVKSLFIQLQNEMKKRKIDAQGTASKIMIMIHNFERFHEHYESCENDLQQLLREGDKYNITIYISLCNVQGLPYRLSQYIQNTIMFQVKEQGDYRLCYPDHNGLYPINQKGSGIFYKKEVFLFQIAIYKQEEIQSIVQTHQGCCSFQIPILPQFVKYEVDKRATKIFIGLDIHSKEEICIECTQQFVYIVANYAFYPPFLAMLEKQLENMSILVIHCNMQQRDEDRVAQLTSILYSNEQVIIVWKDFIHVQNCIEHAVLNELLNRKKTTHIIMEVMKEFSTYAMFDWFSHSLMDCTMLWIGSGILDHQFVLKRSGSDLQNRLQKNRAYFWEEEQCREIQLWEVE